MEKDEFFELVKSSRTYRRYDGKPVGEDVLRDLVDAARMAPTGNNTQLLRFCVVGEESPAKSQLVFSHLHWAGALKDWDGPEVYQRPGGYVVICVPAAAATNPIRLLDVGIAAQTVALAAAARGLGCCMHKSYDAVLGDELGLTEKDLAVALVISVGGRGEKVVLERAGVGAAEAHGLTYWRETDGSHHVPKLELEDLLA